jgi:hypothetical protein
VGGRFVDPWDRRLAALVPSKWKGSSKGVIKLGLAGAVIYSCGRMCLGPEQQKWRLRRELVHRLARSECTYSEAHR